jgi:ketosteroid isomerase-like protein
VERPDLAAVADELAIRALVARYCHAVAERDDRAWADTWAPDAEWCVLGKTVQGRDAILAHYRALVSGARFVLQFAGDGLIELAGDRARGRWQIRETLQWNDGRPGLNLGLYRDEYARAADGAWRFARRAFEARYLGAPDLSAPPLARPAKGTP